MKSQDTEPSFSILKKSKKSKRDNLVVQPENIITEDQALKKKKRKNPEHSEQQYDTSQKKAKKRKKGDPEEQEESMEHKDAEGDSEPPKKKHKNRTSFSDPREDTQLNTQSRKALEYIFTQMNRPSRWKFNKARQNWLIRNVWSSETVPDIYFPLVLKYLANVQGGSREKLRESCQTYLTCTAKVIPIEAQPSTSLDEADIKPAKPIPGPLITLPFQPTPGAIVPATTITGAPTPVSDAATSLLASIKRSRAKSLLDVLT